MNTIYSKIKLSFAAASIIKHFVSSIKENNMGSLKAEDMHEEEVAFTTSFLMSINLSAQKELQDLLHNLELILEGLHEKDLIYYAKDSHNIFEITLSIWSIIFQFKRLMEKSYYISSQKNVAIYHFIAYIDEILQLNHIMQEQVKNINLNIQKEVFKITTFKDMTV